MPPRTRKTDDDLPTDASGVAVAEQRTEDLDKPQIFTVRTRDGKRTLFEGQEDDAYEYVENNFPHVHAEPGQTYGPDGPEPDVYVHGPDGERAGYFAGGEWYSESGEESSDDE
jgi:hypothetical protein